MEELVKKVEQWAADKGILPHSTPLKQCVKTLEEATELLNAIIDNNEPEIIDGIGDVLVTIIIGCKMQEIDFITVYEKANINIINSLPRVDFKPTQILFMIVKPIWLITESLGFNMSNTPSLYRNSLESLIVLCKNNKLDLTDCLQTAYNVISKRNGEMVDGLFVKEASN